VRDAAQKDGRKEICRQVQGGKGLHRSFRKVLQVFWRGGKRFSGREAGLAGTWMVCRKKAVIFGGYSYLRGSAGSSRAAFNEGYMTAARLIKREQTHTTR